MRQCFEDIRLSCKLRRVAEASVGMQHEGICRGELTRLLHPVVDEAQLGEILAAPVIENVQTASALVVRAPRLWNYESVRLRRPINLRAVATDNQSALFG